ncbi:MAG TPA: YqgE/AlgH family protein [Luteimonas sp.]|nr:YqgE/AlgH family protein [Luteimonas sp.]
MSAPGFIANQLLIALPALADPHFARSVALICQHDADGAMGVVINRASEYTLGEVFQQMGINCDDANLRAQVVLAGGPVHPERGFVLHDGTLHDGTLHEGMLHEGMGDWDSSLAVSEELSITTSRDILEAMARGDGPRHAMVALGCAGWGAGQLEHELVENSWLTAPVAADVLYSLPLEARWRAAAGLIGVDMARIADYAGHA